MSPTLNDGDYVFTIKPRSFRPGFIYVVVHTDLGRIIKRLERRQNDKYYFAGDNSNSTPSAVIGPVSARRITARAMFKISKHGVRRL